MSNSFLALPAPAGNGSGAAVDTSALGIAKTVQCVNQNSMTVNIEAANDAGATVWSPVCTFHPSSGQTSQNVSVVARWMRSTVSGNASGSAPVVNVGADLGVPVDALGNVKVAILEPVDGSGNVKVNIASGQVSVTLPTDAFGRVRVSEPQTLFDSKQIADKQPLFWDDQLISGAGGASTYNTNQASTTLSVSNLTAGVRARQTFRSFNYQPGKSQLLFLTGVLGAGAAGITRRIGQFNAQNGLFFELAGSTLSVVRRTFTSGSAVDNVITQANWNLDKLNGSGPSGITIDVTKTQIFVIDYEWLGVGTVRFGFVLGGDIVYCHEIDNSNTLTLVYMSSPNLPLRYEIRNDGTGAAASIVHICTTVISEGGAQSTGIDLSVNRGDTALHTNNDANFYPLIAIRLQSNYLFATVVPSSISVMTTSSAAYLWQLLLNPTITGTALSFTPVPNSACEAATGATGATTVSGGTVLASGYDQSTNPSATSTVIAFSRDLALGASIAGVSDVLVLAVARITGTGTAEDFFGALGYHEQK